MSSEDWLEHAIFAGGHPKSGTTLLTALLDGHPELLVIPEETYFARVVAPAIAAGAPADRVVDLLLYHTRMRLLDQGVVSDSIAGNLDYSNFDMQSFEQELRNRLRETPVGGADVFKVLVATVAAHVGGEGYRAWLEKTPENPRYHRMFRGWFPEAVIVDVVRDPRDVWVSISKKLPDLHVAAFCHNWLRFQSVRLDLRARLPQRAFVALRFEDLVCDTEPTMRALLETLGLAWWEGVLVPTRNGVPWRGNSMWGERRTQVSRAPVGRWRTVGVPEEIRYVEARCSRWMAAAGYEVEPASLGTLARAVAAGLVPVASDRSRYYARRLHLQLGHRWWHIKQRLE